MKTLGTKIIDTNGKEMQYNGLSWFGMEGGNYAPHGIWQRSMGSMLDQIKTLGFNLIRIPYCNQMLDTGVMPNGIDYNANPTLKDKTPLQILDIFIDEAGKRGLSVFLDRHEMTKDSGWEVWYNDQYNEDRWIKDWVLLATRYKGNPTVIGADLHNEPHGKSTWETWATAAEKCGNAILTANPDWLIIIEGVESFNNDWYWWGGNLQGVATRPIKLTIPNKVVYSPHDYGQGVHDQAWFNTSDFPANMPAVWEKQWGFIITQKLAPILIGEFGGRTVDKTTKEGMWQNRLVDYIKEKGLYWTYWCLNPNSGDTGGILKDDWVSVNQDKMDMLARCMVASPTPTPTPTPIPTPAPTGLQLGDLIPYTSLTGYKKSWLPVMQDGKEVGRIVVYKK